MSGVTDKTKNYWINYINKKVDEALLKLVQKEFNGSFLDFSSFKESITKLYVARKLKEFKLDGLHKDYVNAGNRAIEYNRLYRQQNDIQNALKNQLDQAINSICGKGNHNYYSDDYERRILETINIDDEIKLSFPEFYEKYSKVIALKENSEHSFMMSNTDRKVIEWAEKYLRDLNDL